MSTGHPDLSGLKWAGGRIALIAARWNAIIVDKLLSGCEARLAELGVPGQMVEVSRVPGAFELPLAAQWAIDRRGFDGVVVIGCVIRGETWHFEAVAGQCARGVAEVGLRTGKPVIFGVLTVENEAQAIDRCGGSHGHAGRAAADAVVEMINLRASLAPPAPTSKPS